MSSGSGAAAGDRAYIGMVSCRAVGVFARIAERSSTSLEELSAGLDIASWDLSDPSKRIPWSVFCELSRRVEETCGGPSDFVEAATEFTTVPSLKGIFKVSQLLTSVRLLYWSAHRWVGPLLFPGTRSEYETLDDGRIRFSLQIPDELDDSPQFFRLNLAGMRSMPRILGQPDAWVDADIQRRHATYVISPPPSMTLWARVRRSVIVLASARATFNELATQNEQLLEQLEALKRARAEAHEARLLAERQRHAAEEQRRLAEVARAEADAARKLAEDASQLKSEFLTNVSHELRTPLNAILGLTGLVLDESLPENVRGDLTRVRLAGSSLLTLVNDLLDVSRIEAGKMELQEVDFDLRYLLEGVFDTFLQVARESGVALAYRMGHEVPARVVGDPGRLRQVLTNLVGNALKFTPAGGEVGLLVTCAPAGARAVFRFEVSDTGPGISEEDRDRIFQPFVQADGSYARRHGGTGLGLSISKDIVDLLGGSLELESEVGRGSRFTVTLPLALAAAAGHRPLPLAALEGRRVLLVDEQRLYQLVVLEELRAHGVEVLVADSGEEAVRLIRAEHEVGRKIDVALLDRDTSRRQGRSRAEVPLEEALTSWRADAVTHSPAATSPGRMPLVLLASTSQRGEGAEAERAGFAGFLSKPFRREDLVQVLGAVLQRAESPSPSAPVLVTRHRLAEAAASGARVLVVDDDLVNQMVLVRLLKHLGLEAVTARGGQEALDALEHGSFRAVFMDCQMPDVDGYEATRRWREREKARGGRVLIVAVTAHAMAGDREACLACGMDDYLPKPVSRDALAAMLERWGLASTAPVLVE